MDQIGRSFFGELKNATFRASYGTFSDSQFCRSASEDIMREAIVSSRSWIEGKDHIDCRKILYAEDFSKEVIDDLFSRVKFNNLPNYPGYLKQRLTEYIDAQEDARIETDGLILAELVSVFGSELLHVKPADLIVLFLSEISTQDIIWYRVAVEMGIRTIVVTA
jgi:hypothetical protein